MPGRKGVVAVVQQCHLTKPALNYRLIYETAYSIYTVIAKPPPPSHMQAFV